MKVYNTQQTADLLGITTRTLAKRREDGQIAYIQAVPGGKITYTEEAIQAYLARLTHRASPVEVRQTYRKARR